MKPGLVVACAVVAGLAVVLLWIGRQEAGAGGAPRAAASAPGSPAAPDHVRIELPPPPPAPLRSPVETPAAASANPENRPFLDFASPPPARPGPDIPEEEREIFSRKYASTTAAARRLARQELEALLLSQQGLSEARVRSIGLEIEWLDENPEP